MSFRLFGSIFFFFQAEDGIRDDLVTGVQTCALPIYGTLDWLKLRSQLAEERRAVRDLERQLDSLQRLARELETDPAAQERAAREQFGMIRKGELLYRLVPKVDAASEDSGPTPR